jgi:HAD superfamily phosphatase (TIGR01668 family)
LSILYPDLYLTDIFKIPLEQLAAKGKRAMIFDLDNTLTPWNSAELKEEVIRWFAEIQALGFAVCILSNNHAQRIRNVAERLQIPFVCRGKKPLKKGYLEAMQVLHTSPGDTVMVGDQIFTDILGGNRLGLYTILVQPMDHKEYWGTKITRQFEALVLKKLCRASPGEVEYHVPEPGEKLEK